jgi:hypothetical protein
LVRGKAGAIRGRAVAKLLQLLLGRWLAGADSGLDLALGRRFAFGLVAWGDPLQPVISFQLAHDGFLPLVVLAVAAHAAVKADAVRQNVDVFVLGVGVPRHDKLIFFQAHAIEIALPNLPPLLVCELFAGCGGEGNVQNSPP